MKGKKVLKLKAQAKKFAFKYEGAGVPKGQVGKYYPADDVVLSKGPKPVRNAPKLRSSITPGTVLILLAGRFRGKRVVFLKQLTSGLLLISGPYAINGVPLRRVNQKYVIATKTKVDINGVDVSSVNDALFAREKKTKNIGEEKLFDVNAEPSKNEISPARKKIQDAIDSKLASNINKVEMMSSYLKAKFSLSKADKPHAMVF